MIGIKQTGYISGFTGIQKNSGAENKHVLKQLNKDTVSFQKALPKHIADLVPDSKASKEAVEAYNLAVKMWNYKPRDLRTQFDLKEAAKAVGIDPKVFGLRIKIN